MASSAGSRRRRSRKGDGPGVSGSRPFWTGQISFGLVSIPVGLYSATEAAERLSFHLLHRKDKAPIQYRKFCSRENKEVSNDEIVKGRKAGKNRWVIAEKEDLAAAAEEATPEEQKNLIEVLQFVPPDSIDPLTFDEQYYVAPRKGGEKPYGVLRRALDDSGRAGIVRLTLRTRPHLAALLPGPKSLALATLRPFEEMRDPKKLPLTAAPARAGEVELAKVLIERLSSDGWDPAAHPDAYRAALKKLLASRRPAAAAAAAEEERPDNVVDLMEALRRSLGKTGGKAPRKRAARRAGAA
jgi:DNA end-binding protein Ku